MASTGNVFVGTGENNAGIGATAWSNPGNIVSDNGSDATCAAAASSQYLVARNANLTTVPTNATIGGILVRVEASEHTSGTEPLLARLQDASGALFGTGKSTSNEGSISGTAKAVYTYGSTTDVWGATLTGNIIHDADFGVRFWFTTAHDIRIDYVTIAVEYTVPGPGSATETNTAYALGKVKTKAVGLATETETASSLAAQKSKVTASSLETNTAAALSALHIAAVSLSTESNEAFALTRYLPPQILDTGLATESSTTYALGLLKLAAVGLAEETETANSLATLKLLGVSSTDETDLASALPALKLLAIFAALESDTAYALSAPASSSLTTLFAFRYDSACS